MSSLREGDCLEYLSPNELAVILNEREADALLAVLENALNEGITPGVGLRVEDARVAGFKIVSERFRDQDPYNRGLRLVATVARPGKACPLPAPGMTDLMVTPESIDAYFEKESNE